MSLSAQRRCIVLVHQLTHAKQPSVPAKITSTLHTFGKDFVQIRALHPPLHFSATSSRCARSVGAGDGIGVVAQSLPAFFGSTAAAALRMAEAPCSRSASVCAAETATRRLGGSGDAPCTPVANAHFESGRSRLT